jgi:hypothetical protein
MLLWCRGTRTIVGNFSSEQEAARAYDAAARELHGAAAKLNFQTDATAGVADTDSNARAAAATAAAAADSFGFADLEDTRLLNSLWGAEGDGSSSAVQGGQAAAEADTVSVLYMLIATHYVIRASLHTVLYCRCVQTVMVQTLATVSRDALTAVTAYVISSTSAAAVAVALQQLLLLLQLCC